MSDNGQARSRREKYLEKLKDPRWQRKRLEIMKRDGWACQMCGETTKTLNVHHLCYHPAREPWESANYELVTLCCDCHEMETIQDKVIRYSIDEKLCWPWDSQALKSLASFLDALCFEYLPWHWSEDDMRASIRKRGIALQWFADKGFKILQAHWHEAEAEYEETEGGLFVEPEDIHEVLKYHQQRKGYRNVPDQPKEGA